MRSKNYLPGLKKTVAKNTADRTKTRAQLSNRRLNACGCLLFSGAGFEKSKKHMKIKNKTFDIDGKYRQCI